MATFYLIDQSLKRSGGHHADYARCVASAAKEMGFDTVIGTHTALNQPDSLEDCGAVLPAFRNSIYQKASYLAGLRHLTRAGDYPQQFLKRRSRRNIIGRVRDFLSYRKSKKQRDKLIRNFAMDCERFFSNVIFSSADHAFFTAVSEIELMGLANYLATQPRTLQVQWHLQFHFNLFDGRPPEYPSQLGIARLVQSCFDAALNRVPYHSLRMYTTSEPLAEQFNQLGVADFESLPYPVSPRFLDPRVPLKIFSGMNEKGSKGELAGDEVGTPIEERLHLSGSGHEFDLENEFSQGPIQIACPGELRREKGFSDYMQPLVDELWEPYLRDQKLQFVVQRPKLKLFERNKYSIDMPEGDISQAINFRPHPLPENQYVDLLKSADGGLLFYDSRVYYSRRAGVLGELLSCGTPVIVPAGSWLSDQVQPAIEQHVLETARQSETTRSLPMESLEWDSSNVPHPGGVFSFDQERHPFQLDLEPQQDEEACVIQFRWHWPDSSGVYCRIEFVETLADQTTQKQVQVVGKLGTVHSRALFNLHPECQRVQIRFTNAFHDTNISLKQLNVSLLAGLGKAWPRGAVGIIAPEQSLLPDAIDELVNHLDHYQQTAKARARQWYLQHDPKRTIARLISYEHQSAKSA